MIPLLTRKEKHIATQRHTFTVSTKLVQPPGQSWVCVCVHVRASVCAQVFACACVCEGSAGVHTHICSPPWRPQHRRRVTPPLPLTLSRGRCPMVLHGCR